ncbi:MAG: cytochrome c3 family protein [Gammaproteobacteria bacterium]|nr:cytochrome c3 family protein [Gammaproteobacteria bacterium]
MNSKSNYISSINRIRTIFSGLFVTTCGMLIGSQVIAGEISNTAHDFSTSAWSGGEICIVCHTPHNADTSVTTAPLWNHEVTTATFTMYSSPTMDATGDGTPTGSSKLCLSCHDGTVAYDSFGGNTGGTFMSGPATVGASGNLSDDHPISITYDAALATADEGLHDPTVTSVTIGDLADKSRTGMISALMLPDNKVQCSSCHDVHNNFVAAGTNGAPFLRVTKTGSAICLTCHNK